MNPPTIDAGNLMQHARYISSKIAAAGFDPDHDLTRQALGIAEEAGEFVGAFRRWKGWARRSGTYQEMLDELADVFIVALVACERFGEDIEDVIGHKLAKVYTRGWREQDA